MKKNLLSLILISATAITLFSCKKDKDDPANAITDSQGLNVKVNWTMTDGSDAITGADIDFYVYKGVGASRETTPQLAGDHSGSFEDEDFLAALADGDYTLEIDYFEVNKTGKFNVVFKAMSGDKTYSFSDNSFAVATEGTTIDFIKINKNGTKYTVSKL